MQPTQLESAAESCSFESSEYASLGDDGHTFTIDGGIDWMLEQEMFRRVLEGTGQEQYSTLRQYIAEGKLAPRYRGTKAAVRGL